MSVSDTWQKRKIKELNSGDKLLLVVVDSVLNWTCLPQAQSETSKKGVRYPNMYPIIYPKSAKKNSLKNLHGIASTVKKRNI